MKNVQLKTLGLQEQPKISQVPVGTKFKFNCDIEYHRPWTYEKNSEKTIKCIEAPKTFSSSVNETLPLEDSDHLEITLI